MEESGTTRDRVEAVVKIKRFNFKLVDTGGYLESDLDVLSPLVKEQIFMAVGESSMVILVADAIAGLVPSDIEVAGILRKSGKPLILVINKVDNKKLEEHVFEFYQLGFDCDPVAISCLHRRGLKDLEDRILACAGDMLVSEKKDEGRLKIAVVGRPNVGKSSYVNNLLRTDRVIVSDIPGTTRDSIDTVFSYDGDEYVLIPEHSGYQLIRA